MGACCKASTAIDVNKKDNFLQNDLGNLEWYKQSLPNHQQKLEIIHFNDVYNIDERQLDKNSTDQDIVAGAARFAQALHYYGSKEKLVIFSGDLFFPSILSTKFEGEQMVYPFEQFNVDISCLGNHELDMGIEHAVNLIGQTSCPWIMSNLFEKDKGMKPIAGLSPHHVLEHQGFKIGFLGFAEQQWLDQLTPEIDLTQLEHQDYNKVLQEKSKELKGEHECNLVIAINHMRVPEDEDMAAKNSAPDVVDFIFGGHDHSYYRSLNKDTGVFIQKSGTDFECFTNLTVLFGVEETDYNDYVQNINSEGPDHIETNMEDIELFYNKELKRMFISERVNITRRFVPERDIFVHVKKYAEELKKFEQKVAFVSECDIEARFSRLRTQETNLGNWTADLIRTELDTEVALLNTGTIRANGIFEAGQIKNKFLSDSFPMEDKLIPIRISGALILKVLENGVSLYPKYDGRFPCVSGLQFTFDPSKEPGERIVPGSVMLKDSGELLDPEKKYTMALKEFLTAGKDGYDAFLDPSIEHLLEDKDEAPTLPQLFLKHLSRLQMKKSEFLKMPLKGQNKTLLRIEKLNTNLDNRCPQTGFIKINPKVEGRIINLAEPIQHAD